MTFDGLLKDSVQYDYGSFITDELPFQDLSTLMATNKDFQAAGQSVIKMTVHRLLTAYGLNPERFRALLRWTGMVLGGYTILQLLLRHETGSLSLEVFASESSPHNGLERLHEELLHAGYELAEVEDGNAEPARLNALRLWCGIAALREYTRRSKDRIEGNRINVRPWGTWLPTPSTTYTQAGLSNTSLGGTALG
ncbi:hypothetical protein M407DRAFT_30244 [Tulasnella calospora MUT 4182]|uniref:Uncharacterized protein n=1 Tax=Tulasnella calospora MUT 4182 TaxID=1051891 RepID=A0A0C3LF55_9AGAM|nr:hypothetical protein M407DRAFT_30244 [Tulasnella calospora MUT 4182]